MIFRKTIGAYRTSGNKTGNLPVGTVLDLEGDVTVGDSKGTKWKLTSVTGIPSVRVNKTTFNDASGKQWKLVCGETTTLEAFADLETLQPEDGDFPKRFVCVERANAEYLLQPSGYVALAGDVTFANGRVAALQVTTVGLVDYFGDVSVDAIDAVDAAISRGLRVVLFRPDIYPMSRKISVNRSTLTLASTSDSEAILRFDNSTDGGIVFSPSDALATGFLNGQGMSNIRVTSLARNDVNPAITIIKSERFKMRDVRTVSFSNGLHFEGGQFNSVSGLIISSPGNSETGVLSGSAAIRIKPATTSAGLQQAYTLNFDDIFISGGKVIEDLIDIQNSDGCNFSNGYIALGGRSLLKLESTTDKNVAALQFENFYFDGVYKSTDGTPNGLYIPEGAGTGTISATFGSGVFFGQFADKCINVDSTKLAELRFDGSGFTQSLGSIGSINGSSSLSRLSISSCSLRNSGGGLAIANLSSLLLNNNILKDVVDGFTLSGEINRKQFYGNNYTNTSQITDISTSTSTSSLEASWHTEKSYTPELSFGGDSTGVTYSAQQGRYSVIGNTVTCNIYVFLSSKGTAAGDARMSLPVLPSGSKPNAAASVYATNLSSSINAVMSNTQPGTSTISLQKFANGSVTSIKNTDLLDNTLLRISVSYFI